MLFETVSGSKLFLKNTIAWLCQDFCLQVSVMQQSEVLMYCLLIADEVSLEQRTTCFLATLQLHVRPNI